MRFLLKLIFALLFLILIHASSFIIHNSYAEGEFETDYKVTYLATIEGRTNVTQAITLKNKTPNYYADKFELKIGSTKVEDVKANDSTGPLETNVKFEDNVTIISVKFNQRVIGIDKTLPWTLNYSSSELVTKSGQIWEVSIPRITNTQDIGQYEVAITIPSSFGPNAFAIPTPKNSTVSHSLQEYTFEKSQLIENGIAMSFGTKQVFAFTLNYFLENSNLTSRLYEIALPPDNNYQKVVYNSIEPRPIDVFVDEDGNFKAKYKLAPKQRLNISVLGSVEVFHKPFRNLTKELSEKERVVYLSPQKYWETDNGYIRDKATELKTPQEIYLFVTNFLSYSQERLSQEKIERKGAASAIATPKDSVCMEFTDLFIALARAAGIPAREVEGYAFTQNERLRPLSLVTYQGDLLHAWPEYWDSERGWVQVDPTWGSTSGGLDYFNKLDFNHITFIQRGTSSTFPFPAGAYKNKNDLQKKSVEVSFSQELTKAYGQPELSLEAANKVISGIPLKITAEVKNNGNSSVTGGILNLDSPNFENISQNPINLAILPPFSQKNFEYNLHTKGFFNDRNNLLTLTFADSNLIKIVTIVPIYYLLLTPSFMLTISLSAVILALGFFLYEKYHKKKF